MIKGNLAQLVSFVSLQIILPFYGQNHHLHYFSGRIHFGFLDYFLWNLMVPQDKKKKNFSLFSLEIDPSLDSWDILYKCHSRSHLNIFLWISDGDGH